MSDAGITVGAAAPAAGERTASAHAPSQWGRFFHWMVEANVVMVTALAIFSGLFVGAILIIVTQPNVLHAWAGLFSHPGTTVSVTFFTVGDAYRDLFTGSLGDPFVFGHAIRTGQGWTQALTPISETLLYASPLCLAGLGVGLGFRTGMFNIGGQGQLIGGAMAASYVGFEINPPAIIHIPLCILAGFAGGAVVGFVPGFLKARTGAHEVIVTIMLNYVMLNLLVLALTTQPFQQPGQQNAVGRTIFGGAQLPRIFGHNLRVNLGVLIAVVCALGVSWLLRRGTLGFGFRVVGANPNAARVAGINIRRATILVLVISGGLCGLAGMTSLCGADYFLSSGYGGTVGFDCITVALLGRNRPVGIVLGSLLFAALNVGGRYMQASTGIPLDLASVIQAIIVFFVATPGLVNEVYRLRGMNVGQGLLTRGWAA
ncbi:MAG: ABC transporter permease [Acidimicrobiales bacterium]